METLTIILLIAIAVFAIGNILLFFLEKRNKDRDAQRLPLGPANNEIISSKLDVLNKRINSLEQKRITDSKKEVIIIKKPKKIITKRKPKPKVKTGAYPITKYKRKKK